MSKKSKLRLKSNYEAKQREVSESVELTVSEDIETNSSPQSSELDRKRETIYEYAYCGGVDFFNSQIEEVSLMAEQEVWTNREDGIKNVLKSYIIKTFERCYKLNIIKKSEDNKWSCFNTGLMTINGQDIVGLFSKNTKKDQQEWYFVGFKTESDREFLNNFTELPEIATYSENHDDYYFDTSQEITLSIDHILDDNFDRYPEEVKKLGKEILKSLLMSAFEATKKKIKRNNRLVVPQFYNDKFSYLMPIKIPVSDDKYVTMALAVEKMALGNYRANTIFTTEMAYSKARLVMKPESNWLIESKKE